MCWSTAWHSINMHTLNILCINLKSIRATYPLSFSSCMHATLLPSASTLPTSRDQEPCLWLSCGVLMKKQLMIRPNTPWPYGSCWKTQKRGKGGDDPVSLPNINAAILRKGSSGQHPPQGCPVLLWMVRTQGSQPRPSAPLEDQEFPTLSKEDFWIYPVHKLLRRQRLTNHARRWEITGWREFLRTLFLTLWRHHKGLVPRVKSSSWRCSDKDCSKYQLHCSILNCGYRTLSGQMSKLIIVIVISHICKTETHQMCNLRRKYPCSHVHFNSLSFIIEHYF